MRLSELAGKEVVNLTDASRLGTIKDAQVLIDTDTGRVEAILLPRAAHNKPWGKQYTAMAIPWRSIRRWGRDLVIVEIKPPSPEDPRRAAMTWPEVPDTQRL